MDITPSQELVSTIRDLHRRGWCDGTGGNFSIVTQRSPLTLLMAPSGVDKGTVDIDMLIEVNDQAKVVKGKGKASAETLMHLKIVEICGSSAVLHTHSINSTLLSREAYGQGQITLEGWEMLKGLRGITTHDTQVNLPIIANDQNLTRLSTNAESVLNNAPYGLLVAGHGLYAWGDTLQEAKRHVEILEFLLELHWKQHILNLR
ncbi:MAG: methylthioribulose 1-phosphate dehydratase [Synechococcus sp.]